MMKLYAEWGKACFSIEDSKVTAEEVDTAKRCGYVKKHSKPSQLTV